MGRKNGKLRGYTLSYLACYVQHLMNLLKLCEASETDGISNECLWRLPRRPLVHVTHLFSYCFRLSHILSPWKEAERIATRQRP